ncbi:MAG: hypothetical protein ACRDZ7_19600 [Acidimicrobiia bacterium]
MPAERLAARVRTRLEARQLPGAQNDPVLVVAAVHFQPLTATVARRASEALAYLVPYDGPDPSTPESYPAWLNQICRETVIPNWRRGLNLVPIMEAAIVYDEVITEARVARLTAEEATRLVADALRHLDIAGRWQAPARSRASVHNPGLANAVFQEQRISQWAMANSGGWAVAMPGGGIWTVGGSS